MGGRKPCHPGSGPPGEHCRRTFQLRVSVKDRQGLLRTVTFGAFFNSDFQMLPHRCVTHKQGRKGADGIESA